MNDQPTPDEKAAARAVFLKAEYQPKPDDPRDIRTDALDDPDKQEPDE